MQHDRTSVTQQLEGRPIGPPPRGSPFGGLGAAVRGRARLAGVRVLVVEDEEDSRDLVCALLDGAGATVLCVGSVAEAMEGVYESFDPDVVLTDFSMPTADGFDLIREFRKAPSTRAMTVPILILSGHTEEDWRARARAAGAADVLAKPFDPAFLIARIAEAVTPGGSEPD